MYVAYGMYLFIYGLFILAINSPDYALSVSIQVLQSRNIISLAQGPGGGWMASGTPCPRGPQGLDRKEKRVFVLILSRRCAHDQHHCFVCPGNSSK
jgi:hypothetical protein